MTLRSLRYRLRAPAHLGPRLHPAARVNVAPSMRHTFIACLLIAVAGCAGFAGAGLVPGVATEAEVEKVMGPSADRRQRSDGEVVRYYSRLPAGREVYAARFGRDGKLIAIEQRLTREFAARLVPGKSNS